MWLISCLVVLQAVSASPAWLVTMLLFGFACLLGLFAREIGRPAGIPLGIFVGALYIFWAARYLQGRWDSTYPLWSTVVVSSALTAFLGAAFLAYALLRARTGRRVS